MSHELLRDIGDASAATVAVVTLVKWLPPLAALFTLVWTGIRIYDYFEKRYKERKKQ